MEVSEKAIELRAKKIEQEAEQMYETYREYFDMLEDDSVLSKVRRITSYDIWALGKQLEAFEYTCAMYEAEGNLGQLGPIPQIAFDVITVAYGTSIIPVVASVQPIDEEKGTVYFKNVKAGVTKAPNVTAGDTFVDPKTGQVTPRSFSSNFVDAETIVASTTTATNYTGTLAQLPPRPGTVRITTSQNATFYAIDPGGDKGDGTGDLIGIGISGTITYATGAFDLDFTAAPTAGNTISAAYQVNYEDATDIPDIDQFWDSTTIHSRVYALKGSFGMLQSFAMRRRFGMVAEDELARDLVGQINTEVGGDLIRKMVTAAQGTTDFNKNPSGIGLFEHYQGFKVRLAEAEAKLVGNAGRGTITGIIADVNMCAVIEVLPGFQKLTDGNTLGAHVFGMLDGRVVIRVTDTNIMAANTAVLFWKGPSPFEAAAVYTPYMPLVVTEPVRNRQNPLVTQRAAAVWAGVDVLVGNFATGMTLSSS